MIRRSALALACASALILHGPAPAEDSADTPQDAEILYHCVTTVRLATGSPVTWLHETDESTLQTTISAQTLDDCVGLMADICMESPEGSTTTGMSACLIGEADWWSDLLDNHYRTLQQTLDTESAEALRAAQQSWIKFAGDECDFRYSVWREGTMRSTVAASCTLETTAQRAIQLETYLAWPE